MGVVKVFSSRTHTNNDKIKNIYIYYFWFIKSYSTINQNTLLRKWINKSQSGVKYSIERYLPNYWYQEEIKNFYNPKLKDTQLNLLYGKIFEKIWKWLLSTWKSSQHKLVIREIKIIMRHQYLRTNIKEIVNRECWQKCGTARTHWFRVGDPGRVGIEAGID